MNIAIILAVSEYKNINPLPGCVLDGQLIKSLLDETGKYKEILFIDQETDSVNLKEKLTKFIISNQGEDFDEVFFYYTGHGDFHDNEFYYILSDFDKTSYRQTSLSNLELDNLLRQLNPKLTIKIIDACHSGVTYIKDNDVFNKHLENSKEGFTKCYFMFSSMSDQYSYQTDISHFTKAFIDSVIKYNSTEIRYKHILDFISDEFEKNALQKPFFVIQAGLTETFCSVSQNIKNLLLKQINNSLESKHDNNKPKERSLVELVKRDAERYCSENEALEAINSIKKLVEGHEYSHEMIELYEISSQFEMKYKSVSDQIESIGKWLKSNDNNYFAKIVYERKRVSSKKNNLLTPLQIVAYSLQPEPDAVYKDFISGFDITVDVPFKLINIDAIPKYLALDTFKCNIVYLFSPTAIRLFYYYSIYKLETWGEYAYDSSSEWQTTEVEIKNFEQLKEAVYNILNSFDSFVIEPLKARYT